MTTGDNDILIRQKLAKSKKRLAEINNLIQFGYYDTAVNRIYYASFYSVQALLLSINLNPKSHKGVLTMFALHFVKTGLFPEDLAKFYPRIFNERLIGDYEDVNETNKDWVGTLFSTAVIFNNHIEKMLS
jgi:uncharacterized protein (UPF0332 family)